MLWRPRVWRGPLRRPPYGAGPLPKRRRPVPTSRRCPGRRCLFQGVRRCRGARSRCCFQSRWRLFRARLPGTGRGSPPPSRMALTRWLTSANSLDSSLASSPISCNLCLSDVTLTPFICLLLLPSGFAALLIAQRRGDLMTDTPIRALGYANRGGCSVIDAALGQRNLYNALRSTELRHTVNTDPRRPVQTLMTDAFVLLTFRPYLIMEALRQT